MDSRQIRSLAEQERGILESLAATYSLRNGELVASASWSPRHIDLWGTTPLPDPTPVQVGDHVLVESRGHIRAARVYRVGRKNVTVAYVTPGGIQEARDYIAKGGLRPWRATITVKTVPVEELHGWDANPANRRP
jgi:hypothetical protein